LPNPYRIPLEVNGLPACWNLDAIMLDRQALLVARGWQDLGGFRHVSREAGFASPKGIVRMMPGSQRESLARPTMPE
jgi:hypothetical protein